MYSLFGQPEFCLIFILSKNNDFQPGALLKLPPSSTSMEEFGLDIQKKISLKQPNSGASTGWNSSKKYDGFLRKTTYSIELSIE